jgi:hypothetical protein
MSGAGPAPDDPRRRLRAKRQNERVKLVVSFVNTAALAILGAAFIVPGISGTDSIHWNWVPVAFILHLCAHAALSLLKSED